VLSTLDRADGVFDSTTLVDNLRLIRRRPEACTFPGPQGSPARAAPRGLPARRRQPQALAQGKHGRAIAQTPKAGARRPRGTRVKVTLRR